MPQRIQRRRQKGWRMPEGAIYVGRSTKWGNPFAVRDHIRPVDPRWPYIHRLLPESAKLMPWSILTVTDRRMATTLHFDWFIEQPHLMLTVAEELGGHDLACFCPLDQPCHADFLLEMANPGATPVGEQ